MKENPFYLNHVIQGAKGFEEVAQWNRGEQTEDHQLNSFLNYHNSEEHKTIHPNILNPILVIEKETELFQTFQNAEKRNDDRCNCCEC